MSSNRESLAFDAAMLRKADALIRREIVEVSTPRAEDKVSTVSPATT
jgi:hypothetical protein